MTSSQQPPQARPPQGALAGKVAIVTGASRGVGRAVAALFAAEGAAVVLASRNLAALAANAATIEAAGGRALAVSTDVSDEQSVADLFARTAAAFAPPDILVNSAGAVARVPFERMEAAIWDEVLGVNLRGTFLCCRAAFRAMIPRGGGVIVNLSSLSGVRGVEKFPGLGLSEILAVEGRPHNIRVVAVSPGAVDTEMLREAAPHLRAGMTPEELARILLFLVGPDARPLSGTNLEIFSNA